MVGQRGNGVVDTRAGTIDVDFEPERGRWRLMNPRRLTVAKEDDC